MKGSYPERPIKRQLKVAIIDNSINPLVYNPTRHWTSHFRVYWESFEAKKGCLPSLNKDYSHIILTGSEASILEREKWVEKEAEFIAQAVERGVPILGSCYGHQLLALALGGPSWLRKSRHPEVGWIPIQIKKNKDLLGNQGTAFAFSSHFDEVAHLGKGFEILASSAHCPIQAFRLKDKPAWGLQFHPEMNIKEAKLFIKNSISLKLETQDCYKEALSQKPQDSQLIIQIIEYFLSSSAIA